MTATGASASLATGSNRLQPRAAGRVVGMCVGKKRGGKRCTVGKGYSNHELEQGDRSFRQKRNLEQHNRERVIGKRNI